ncbi:MAG: peptidoglycan bridge formation glycyltransferase FemA/FemB family protein [Bacilli bacterium]|nr:peptidoglycan bridge formation glycyltransferase FemA/FemB family protein [Bacilli bacterium]
MYLKELTNEEFSNFTDVFFQSSVYQTKEYAFAMNKQGFDSVFLGLIDDNKHIVAASLLLIQKKSGFKYAYAPRGFLIDYTNFSLLQNFTTAIKKYLGKKDIIAVKIAPMIVKSIYNAKNVLIGNNRNYDTLFENLKKLNYYHLGYNSYFEALKPRFEVILDIDKDLPSLFKNFNRGMKNKVKNSIYRGTNIYRGNKEDLQELYLQVKDRYSRKLGYYDDIYQYFDKGKKVDFYYSKLNTEIFLRVSKRLYETQEQYNTTLNNIIMNKSVQKKEYYISKKIVADTNLERYKTRLVKATNLLRDNPGGIITATALVLKHRDTVYLFMDGYDKRYKEFNGKHLLLWSLIQKYSQEGFKHFSLGGVSNVTLEENDYKGLTTFKTGFGGITYEYAGDFELITNQALYFMYKNAAPLRNIFKR